MSCKRSLCPNMLSHLGNGISVNSDTPKICKGCTIKCPYFKYCKNKVSKEDVQMFYPRWNISGCRFLREIRPLQTKQFCHCIYPINKSYCGKPSTGRCGNICDNHMDDFKVFFESSFPGIFPSVLVLVCFKYFYADPECPNDFETYPRVKGYRNYRDYLEQNTPDQKIEDYLNNGCENKISDEIEDGSEPGSEPGPEPEPEPWSEPEDWILCQDE